MYVLKRIVSLNYPASRLPARFRGDIEPWHRVTVTVEEKGPEGAEFETIMQDFAELAHGPVEDDT